MLSLSSGAWRITPLLALLLPQLAHAATQACARPAPGSVITAPPDLYSSHGVLSVALNYVTSQDADDRALYCYVTPDGIESPTLHLNPGDKLKIALTNTQQMPLDRKTMVMPLAGKACADDTMSGYSVNIHFHGINAKPVCGSDETIRTIINPGETFNYTVEIPSDEPPGLYWYHPHVHGISSSAVQGGASGAIIIEGIEKLEPKVANLPARVLVIRDQQVVGNPNPGGKIPTFDVSLNYSPVDYPALVPAVIEAVPGQKEFWRVLNASADLISDLQLTYDGVPQPFEVVALDGVPLGSQDGTRKGKTEIVTHLLVPPAGRAELIMTNPPAGVHRAILETLKIHGGPAQDNNTHRILAVFRAADTNSVKLPTVPDLKTQPTFASVGAQRFEGLDDVTPTAHRRLYFYEFGGGANRTNGHKAPENGQFFIVVQGQIPQPFDPAAPPAITTTEGAVEDWVIQNRTTEVHEFHIHQIHFQVRAINGVAVPKSDRQFQDTFQVPFWTGKGPYPTVTLRMDFRGNIAGDFVYHCHILDHEDLGMMAKIRVLPSKDSSSTWSQ